MLMVESTVDIPTPTGPMRVHTFVPALPGQFPAIAVYTEIYQVTGPIKRTCRQLAGEGYIVASPESYHEYEPPGTALAYDVEGTDRGNRYKITKPVEDFDADTKSLFAYFKTCPQWNGRIGTLGICLGGHLAARAACEPEVSAGVFFFATDIHSRTLGKGKNDNTLERLKTMPGEGLFIWGKQDNHIPREGRKLIYETLSNAEVNFGWVEVNAQHAFIRDEASKGRYDPALARCLMQLALELFSRRLILGLPDQRGVTGTSLPIAPGKPEVAVDSKPSGTSAPARKRMIHILIKPPFRTKEESSFPYVAAKRDPLHCTPGKSMEGHRDDDDIPSSDRRSRREEKATSSM